MSQVIKNNPLGYRSRASIANKARSERSRSVPSKGQGNRLEAALIDSRWYIQFPKKVR